ncbi:MAG: hypothetical protein ACRCXM_04665 [Beijerinckiaceae bacterium]
MVRAQIADDMAEIRARMAAIIATTDDAASLIIANIEQIFADGGTALPDSIQDKLFSMLSACAFHDLAGQHLARMADLVTAIEATAAITADSAPVAANAVQARSGHEAARERRMLHGPALAVSGIRQADIDGHFFEMPA